MNGWGRTILFALLGAAAGWLYYELIGCVSGGCPITSNPYVSTAYGALVGLVAGSAAKGKPKT